MMSVVQSSISGVAIDLDEQSSARVLERAVRAKALLELRAKVGGPAETMAARLIEIRGDSLFVSVTDSLDAALLRSAYCDVGLMLENQQYLFSTNVLDVLDSMEGKRLELVRPRMLQALQRRRFVRADLAESSRVCLGAPGDFDHPACHGVLLNVSCDGLACRVDRGDADAHDVGEMVGVSFSIGALEDRFEFNAAVQNKTRAGTEGTVILGLQFYQTPPRHEQASRLREALELYA